MDGIHLRQAMQAGRFSPSEALGIVPRIFEALQYAHEQGVLHRDIKPENILLDAEGQVNESGLISDKQGGASESAKPTFSSVCFFFYSRQEC